MTKEDLYKKLETILAGHSDGSDHSIDIKRDVGTARLMASTSDPEEIKEVGDYWYQRQFQQPITGAELTICGLMIDYTNYQMRQAASER